MPPPRAGMPGMVAAAIIGLQALGCAVLAVAFPVAAAHDAGLSTVSHVMFGVFTGLFAACLWFAARGLWRGLSWPRTASVVWLVVLLPVAWTLVQSGWRLPGLLILGSSLVAVVAIAAESRRAAK
jgi:hypothetical protein